MRMHKLKESDRRAHTETSQKRLRELRLTAADMIDAILSQHLRAEVLDWSTAQAEVYAALPNDDSRSSIEDALVPFYTAVTGMIGGGHR